MLSYKSHVPTTNRRGGAADENVLALDNDRERYPCGAGGGEGGGCTVRIAKVIETTYNA